MINATIVQRGAMKWVFVTFEQGETVSVQVAYQDVNHTAIDFTGWTVSGVIRHGPQYNDALTIAFNSPRSSGQLVFSMADAYTNTMQAPQIPFEIILTDPNGNVGKIPGMFIVVPKLAQVIV